SRRARISGGLRQRSPRERNRIPHCSAPWEAAIRRAPVALRSGARAVPADGKHPGRDTAGSRPWRRDQERRHDDFAGAVQDRIDRRQAIMGRTDDRITRRCLVWAISSRLYGAVGSACGLASERGGSTMTETSLAACRSESLLGYLKALGVLRLLATQVDAS